MKQLRLHFKGQKCCLLLLAPLTAFLCVCILVFVCVCVVEFSGAGESGGGTAETPKLTLHQVGVEAPISPQRRM